MTDNTKMREAMIDKDGAVWEKIGGAWSLYKPEQAVPVEVFDSRCNYASFAGRVCNKCGRIHDGGKSVPVLGEPVAWVNINKHGDATRTVRRRDNWCTTPVFAKPKTSIPAAELASLREKAAQFDSADMEYLLGCKAAYQQELETRTKFQHELNALEQERKDAERYRKLRGWMSSNVKEGWGRVTDLSAVFCYVSWQEGDSYLDNLPECNVGLMQKDAAIAQGKGE